MGVYIYIYICTHILFEMIMSIVIHLNPYTLNPKPIHIVAELQELRRPEEALAVQRRALGVMEQGS